MNVIAFVIVAAIAIAMRHGFDCDSARAAVRASYAHNWVYGVG